MPAICKKKFTYNAKRCFSGCCRGLAATFMRRTMLPQDGVLLSRESEQPIRRFMDHHRGLQTEDIEFFMNLLTRVAGEAYRP